jgi:alpha-beta hydrolase superfamily lysophospholipase
LTRRASDANDRWIIPDLELERWLGAAMQAFLHTVASSGHRESLFETGGSQTGALQTGASEGSAMEGPAVDGVGPSDRNIRYVHRWWPEGVSAWGALTIVHGFGDHGGRFEGMATSLASFGMAVTAVDLIGHGRSPGRRGVIDSYEQLLDEVETSVELSRRRWPGVPQFLFGQSMGGNLVINWLLRRASRASRIQGAIVAAPLIRASCTPREKYMRAGRWLADRLPNFRLPTPSRVEWLCAERRAQDAYRRDPLVHRTMSLRLATSLVDSGLWAMERAGDLSVRSLLLHGSEDRLTCPKATEEFAARAGGNADFVLCQGCRHELHEEAPREYLFETIAQWAKSRCLEAWVTPSNSRHHFRANSRAIGELPRISGQTVLLGGASIEGLAQGSYTAPGL